MAEKIKVEVTQADLDNHKSCPIYGGGLVYAVARVTKVDIKKVDIWSKYSPSSNRNPWRLMVDNRIYDLPEHVLDQLDNCYPNELKGQMPPYDFSRIGLMSFEVDVMETVSPFIMKVCHGRENKS